MDSISSREIKLTQDGSNYIGEYEPGNGTRYVAVATPWNAGLIPMGQMGSISAGWLVVFGNNGQAHLFQKGGYLTDSYVQEHLGGYPGDYPHIGHLIRALINRPGG